MSFAEARTGQDGWLRPGSAAALAIAAAAGGACKSIKTTPLLDATEGLEAMKLAAGSGYRAPASGRTASA